MSLMIPLLTIEGSLLALMLQHGGKIAAGGCGRYVRIEAEAYDAALHDLEVLDRAPEAFDYPALSHECEIEPDPDRRHDAERNGDVPSRMDRLADEEYHRQMDDEP